MLNTHHTSKRTEVVVKLYHGFDIAETIENQRLDEWIRLIAAFSIYISFFSLDLSIWSMLKPKLKYINNCWIVQKWRKEQKKNQQAKDHQNWSHLRDKNDDKM